MSCVAHAKGRPWECTSHGNCNHSDGNISEGSTSEETSEESEIEINTYKLDSALKDQQSTGRKRAAVMYPLNPTEDCEWRMQKNCGGGSKPIVGCIEGKQQARHHGPDKNTLNNEKGNVHRICHQCHNRWHAKNDEGYVCGSIYPIHSPVEATLEDMALNELEWVGVKVSKVKD